MSEIFVLNDKNYRIEGVSDNYESLIWTDRYSAYGDLEIYTPATLAHIDLLRQNRFLWMEDSEHQMIIEDIQIESDVEDGNHLKITGRSLESILKRRIVWTQTILKGNLQDCVLILLNNNIINPSLSTRRINNFLFERSTDPEITSLRFEGQFTGTELYEAIKKICDSVNIGFKMFLNDNNQIVFKLYKGTDRSYAQEKNPYVVFSQNFENIVDSNYIDSNADLRNVTLVAGEGEGLERKTVVVGDNSISGMDRRELYTDARDISSTTASGDLTEEEYNALLIQRGKEKLLENKIVRAFDGKVDTTRMYRYDQDFFMGDIVQLENEYGMETKARIIEYIYSSSSRGIEEYPTFEVIDED